MFVEREKVYITIATLVVPYLKKDVGEFISLLQTGSLEAGRGKRGGLCINLEMITLKRALSGPLSGKTDRYLISKKHLMGSY